MNPEEVTLKRILSSLLLYVPHQGKFRLSAKHKAHALHLFCICDVERENTHGCFSWLQMSCGSKSSRH